MTVASLKDPCTLRIEISQPWLKKWGRCNIINYIIMILETGIQEVGGRTSDC